MDSFPEDFRGLINYDNSQLRGHANKVEVSDNHETLALNDQLCQKNLLENFMEEGQISRCIMAVLAFNL